MKMNDRTLGLLKVFGLLREAERRFINYQMDAEGDAPPDHRDFMRRLREVVSELDKDLEEALDAMDEARERHGFGSPEFVEALQAASDASEWDEGEACGDGEPF